MVQVAVYGYIHTVYGGNGRLWKCRRVCWDGCTGKNIKYTKTNERTWIHGGCYRVVFEVPLLTVDHGTLCSALDNVFSVCVGAVPFSRSRVERY